MTEIHIFRHGETEWNLEHRAQGSLDSKLTALGRMQAKDARVKIMNVSFDVAFTSTSERAFQTAEILLADQPTPIHPLDKLKEIDMGIWEGMTYEEIQQRYPDEYHNFWNKPSCYKPLGGERFQELEQRAVTALDEITAEHSGKTILLISHAGFIKTLINNLLGRPIDEIWAKPYTSNLTHSVIKRDLEGKYLVMKYCDHPWDPVS
jgi:broad specificity phosphatase PhoE